MRKTLIVILLVAPLLALAAQNITVFGTVKANLALDYYDQYSLLYNNAMGQYYIDNYLLLTTHTRFYENPGVFAELSADLLIQELIASQSDETKQSITFELNEAFLSVPLADFLFFTLGKKRLIWGTGLAYNPSDFINPPQDPLHPYEERQGVYSALLELFTEWLSITQAAVLYDNLEYFGYGTKLSTSALIPALDLNIIFYYSENAGINLGASCDTTPFAEIPVLQNMALHFEAGFSQKSEQLIYDSDTGTLTQRADRDDFYKNFLAGLRYTVPGWETLIAAEYYYIDGGYLPAEIDTIIDRGFIADAIYEPGLMCRHNLMFSITQPQLTRQANVFTDTLELSASLLMNLMDGSFFIAGKIESAIISNCIFCLEGGCFAGKNRTEYGLTPKEFYLGFSVVMGY
ncbi:MAG: hypothetical protein JW822_13025 [Spirochaetales bacterium]|nr:hypothetical protein [Spirochaetales bacterium]